MVRRIITAVILSLAAARAWSAQPGDDVQKHWPQWRGPMATGAAPFGNPPVTWSASENIRWKIHIPGTGMASPVIWGDQVFILSAVDTGKESGSARTAETGESRSWMQAITTKNVHAFTVFSINRHDGKIQWQKIMREALPFAGTHGEGSWASHSPVTDGIHVFSYFGSYGLYCLDLDGNLIWKKDLGDMRTRNDFGEGSSPALFGDKLIINWDHEGHSFITALNKWTGETLWKTERDEITSWATPIVVDVGGKHQIIINATGKTRGYDLETGDPIWESGGMTANVIPSPVHAEGLVYVMSGFRGSALQAIRLEDARGDLEGSDAIRWSHNRDTPYTPSPLLYDNTLYFLKVNRGILSAFNASTGEAYYESESLNGLANVFASPVAVDGRLYIAGRNGVTLVLRHGPNLEILATNTLDDDFKASPAIVGNELYLRGRETLYCISTD